MSLTDALESQGDRLMACVHCGFCLPACPTYQRLGNEADSPRGRLHLMRAVVEGRMDPASDAFQLHIDRCLGCRACEPVCPSGVEYGLLLEHARMVAAEARPRKALSSLFLRVFASPLLLRAALLGGRLLRATGLPALAARLPLSSGLAGHLRLGSAMLAATAPGRFPDPDAARGDPSGSVFPGERASEPAARAGFRGRVGMLEGCVQKGLLSRVNAATRRVLTAEGYEVVPVPGQGCCGALHAHAGDLDAARELARRNVKAFHAAGVETVAVNAAGCGAALRGYAHLLENDPEWGEPARALAEGTRDVSELLSEGGPPRSGASLPVTVTYAPPCHLVHGQRVDAPVRGLLGAVPGLRLAPLPAETECCGGAGIYGITHPELGGRIGRDKVAAVLSTGASIVATGNPGCMMQIGGGLRMAGSRVQARHPVELLDESYRRAGFYS